MRKHSSVGAARAGMWVMMLLVLVGLCFVVASAAETPPSLRQAKQEQSKQQAAPPVPIQQQQPEQQQQQETTVVVNDDGSIEPLAISDDTLIDPSSLASTESSSSLDIPPSPISSSSSSSSDKASASHLPPLTEEEVASIFSIAAAEDDDKQMQQQQQGDKAATPGTLIMERFATSFEKYRNRLSSVSRYYPWAGVIEFLVSIGAACPTINLISEVIALNPPSIHILTKQRHPLNPDGTLPRPWVDLKGYGGDFVDEGVIAKEKDTYYFLYKMYDSFYSFATDTKVDRTVINPLAPGWGPQKVHWRNASTTGGQWRETPFSLVTQKGGHVLVVLRGTMFRDEWLANSIYHFTKHGETDEYFAGRVHTGAFRLFVEMLPFLLDDIRGRNPKRVTFVGHSLGGVIATFLGAYLGKREGEGGREGGVLVEVLTIGAYAPGDKTFWEAAKGGMNVRNLKFLGKGWTEGGEEGGKKRKMYTMGDVAAQAPGVALPNCFIFEASAEEEEGAVADGRPNDFYMPPATVPIWPGSIRNSQAWREKSDMLDPQRMALVMGHKCSYTCWLSEGVGDPDSRCYFAEQQQEDGRWSAGLVGGWWAGVWGRMRGEGEVREGRRVLREGEICRRTEVDVDADYNPARGPRIRGSVGSQ